MTISALKFNRPDSNPRRHIAAGILAPLMLAAGCSGNTDKDTTTPERPAAVCEVTGSLKKDILTIQALRFQHSLGNLASVTYTLEGPAGSSQIERREDPTRPIVLTLDFVPGRNSYRVDAAATFSRNGTERQEVCAPLTFQENS